MDDYISISEFAKKAGVSRQAVYLRLDKDLQSFVKLDNGKKLIQINALGLFNVKRDKLPNTDFTNFTDTNLTELTRDQKAPEIPENMLNVLLSQLDIKDKQLEEKDKQLDIKDKQIAEKDRQIAEKDKQLSDLTELLRIEQQSAQQAQALHAGTIKQTALIESDSCKNSFWTRLFRRSEKK